LRSVVSEAAVVKVGCVRWYHKAQGGYIMQERW
jgi:hypothetical protein